MGGVDREEEEEPALPLRGAGRLWEKSSRKWKAENNKNKVSESWITMNNNRRPRKRSCKKKIDYHEKTNSSEECKTEETEEETMHVKQKKQKKKPCKKTTKVTYPCSICNKKLCHPVFLKCHEIKCRELAGIGARLHATTSHLSNLTNNSDTEDDGDEENMEGNSNNKSIKHRRVIRTLCIAKPKSNKISEIHEQIKQYGKVEYIEVNEDYALVQFENARSMIKAIEEMDYSERAGLGLTNIKE